MEAAGPTGTIALGSITRISAITRKLDTAAPSAAAPARGSQPAASRAVRTRTMVTAVDDTNEPAIALTMRPFLAPSILTTM